ncbi:hypothetical protein [Ruminococcus sp.]|uniref:hypothetical protein n=1 Tax=Ruminococcus sp. TaxID=41978 RepID=UPI003AB2793C
MSYPNQKTISIDKMPCDKNNKYAVINQYAMQKAMCQLKTMGSMKLWLYLAKNKPDYKFDLSCAECGKWGLKPDAFHTAVKELINKGYLLKNKANEYTFIEIGAYRE